MAKVDFTSVQYNTLSTYFSSLNCSLITVSGDTVTIDGRLSFYQESGYIINIKWDGSQIARMTCNFPHTLEVYYGDNIFYVQGTDPQSRRWVAFYEKFDDKVLYGAIANGSSGTSRYGFDSITLTDATSGSTYTHGTMINHAVEVGSIDYIDFTGLFNNGYKKLNDPIFKACSTMTRGITVTIAGNNYYTVSEHDMLPLD